MDSVLNLIFNAENVRMLVILAFVCCAYMLNIRRMDRMEAALNKRIDGVEKRIDELKFNDFAHLCSAFKALTYVLEKNGSLSKEDKEYIDSQL